MTKNDYLIKISSYHTEPTEWDYLLTSCQIAQVDNGVATDKISTSGGGYKEGETVINESFFDDNISCPNKPTWSAVNAIISELKTAYADKEYSRQRAIEYPKFGSQLNKIYDDGVTKWKSEMVDPIKAKWPKDNSGPV